MAIISKTNSEIIVVLELLYDYIKNKYPNIKICASILQSTYQNIKDKDETEHINELIAKYDRVVIRPEYAIYNNGDFSKIKDVSKIEVLVNQYCAMNCERANQDYILLELTDRKLITFEQLNKCFEKVCPKNNGYKGRTNCLEEKIIENCIKSGVKKLKLQGRNHSFDRVFNELCMYFFSEKITKKELREKIENFMIYKLENSVELQLYSLLCKNL